MLAQGMFGSQAMPLGMLAVFVVMLVLAYVGLRAARRDRAP